MTPVSALAEHVVRFYDRDDTLCLAIAEFAKTGIERGERVLLIVTAEHRRAVESLFATERASAPGADRLIWIDANAQLGQLAAGGGVTVDRFREAVEQALGDTPAPYRVFGELVALLAARGMLDMALEIEALGRELSAKGVAVLCAYDLRELDGGDARHRVAGAHDCAIDMTARTGPLVLLAEDFDDARELYQEYLQMQGFAVVTAVDGVEAVARARETRPAAILLDIRMPRMSGIDAMKVLRADAALAGVPIVALTAHALGEERAAFLAAGFDAVLAKPCLPDLLADTVRTLVGRHLPTATPA